jgi:hypothetical protein
MSHGSHDSGLARGALDFNAALRWGLVRQEEIA